MRVVVCEDARMADTSISSEEKASILRSHVLTAGTSTLDDAPLLTALGKQNLALCLIDSEDYELAIPHALFSSTVLEDETLLELTESQRMPSTIGRVVGTPGIAQAATAAATSTMSKGDLSDASGLSAVLSESLASHGLPTKVDWLAAGDPAQAHM